jgi:tetratricopeptide (TPR) repeat protein
VQLPRTTTPPLPVTGRTPMSSRPPADRPVISRTKTPMLQIPAKRPAPPSASPDLDAPTNRRAPSSDLHLTLPNPTDAERKALAEPGDLEPDERLRILAMVRLVDGRDPWALLGVPPGADAKMLKRSYFKLSKDIHPDRYYGKQLGSFADRLTAVFEAVSRTYARLTAPDKDRKSGVYQQVQAEQPQTPGEYATELFERACNLEVGGDALGAMKLFAAAVRIDPQTRYLRRAATCALAAEQPKTALEYAKKAQNQAPNDPSSARLLAAAFKATGRLGDAEEVLVMAMALKSENDQLTAELRNDLTEVRRLMSAPGG